MKYAPPNDRVVRNLTAALLAGEWTEQGMTDRAAAALGRKYRFLRPFARRVLSQFPTSPRFDPLLSFVIADKGVVTGFARNPVRVARVFVVRPVMEPLPEAAEWAIPSLTTVQSLADWFELDPGQLLWLADISGRNVRDRSPKLRNYRYIWVPKKGGRRRLIEAPKARLKQIQRRILADLLGAVPTHPTVHGFRPGRSVLTNAVPHCGRAAVLRFDLADFFASVPGVRVFALFRSLGYPNEVAQLLTGLSTARVPTDVWDARPNPVHDGSEHPTRVRLAESHLPQGAPTSPALANLCAYRLDCRLAGLATKLGATYTRYADDLTFSGDDDLRRAANRVRRLVTEIAAEEGFTVNVRKTRLMTSGTRQVVTGVVVNEKPNVRRADYDHLKAVLTNCVRHGSASQNRDHLPDFRGHLAGRISHTAMLNPTRGAKLRAIFDRIDWTK
jgi:RNA-directed DNA polymerase